MTSSPARRATPWALLLLLPLLAGCPSEGDGGGAQGGGGSPAGAGDLDPSKATATAPDVFRARFKTTKGDIVIEVTRAWAPHGADRFYNLVKMGYYDGCRFFRVLNGKPRPFMAQFGIHGDPAVARRWVLARIQDDPVKQSNLRGFVSYAMSGPNTRTTQVFINYANNSSLDRMGFSPFGKVVEGMDVADALDGEYGEGAPRGPGPDQNLIQQRGNAYLSESFPRLDAIKTARIE